MKKLLTILGSIGLVASTGVTTVVSCNPDKNNNDNNDNNDNNKDDKYTMDEILGVNISDDGYYNFSVSVNENDFNKNRKQNYFISLFLSYRVLELDKEKGLDDPLTVAVRDLDGYFEKIIEKGDTITNAQPNEPYEFTPIVVTKDDFLPVKDGTYKFKVTLLKSE